MGGEPSGFCQHCGNDIDPHHPCGCFETCQCGDYRWEHENGKGPCRHNGGAPDLCHGFEDCKKFRPVVSRGLIDWRDAFA